MTHWYRVDKFHPAALALADRHYSRQTVGAAQFLPPGETLVLVTALGNAVWGACRNLDPVGNTRWRCTIFRNESPVLSSELIREATETTFRFWLQRYGLPPEPFTTEVDPNKTRRKRDPGRCFRRAEWSVLEARTAHGLVLLQAPGESSRCPSFRREQLKLGIP